jgi:hypothetical protein
MPIQFAERIVQQRGVSAENVRRWVFSQGLPPLKRPLAWVLGIFADRAFAHDRLVVEEFCRAQTREEVTDAINLLHRAPVYEHAFVRSTLGCRISGRRLAALADALLREPADAGK